MTQRLTLDDIDMLARAITDDLFTTGWHARATRLQLLDGESRPLAGWSDDAAVDRVKRVLRQWAEDV